MSFFHDCYDKAMKTFWESPCFRSGTGYFQPIKYETNSSDPKSQFCCGFLPKFREIEYNESRRDYVVFCKGSYHYYDTQYVHSLCLTICCMIFGGCLLLVAGVSLMLVFGVLELEKSKIRQLQINEYNSYASEWNGRHRNDTLRLKFQNTTYGVLEPSSEIDIAKYFETYRHERDSPQLVEPKPLFWHVDAKLGSKSLESDLDEIFEFEILGARFPMKLFEYSSTTLDPQKCSELEGFNLGDDLCEFWFVLKKICVVVDTEGKLSSISTGTEKSGCYRRVEFPGLKTEEYFEGMYKSVGERNWINFSVDIQIRSRFDPEVQLLRILDTQNDFPPMNNPNQGIVLVVFSVVYIPILLAVCVVVFFILFILLNAGNIREKIEAKKRTKERKKMEEEKEKKEEEDEKKRDEKSKKEDMTLADFKNIEMEEVPKGVENRLEEFAKKLEKLTVEVQAIRDEFSKMKKSEEAPKERNENVEDITMEKEDEEVASTVEVKQDSPKEKEKVESDDIEIVKKDEI